MSPPEKLLPPHGNYRELLSYQKSRSFFDLTFYFTKRFLQRGNRTVDQMRQAARSGKQNILEGSKASGTSKETELKLTNVARASLEELLGDYEDYLRTGNFPIWSKIPAKPSTFDASAVSPLSPMRPIGRSSRRGRRTLLPTSRSA
ncbi:MAG TPA: four helix bundle protein [Chthoniobacterales bacterium]|jgi:four helix bundle protein